MGELGSSHSLFKLQTLDLESSQYRDMGVGLKPLTLALSVDGLMADNVKKESDRSTATSVAMLDARIREVQSHLKPK